MIELPETERNVQDLQIAWTPLPSRIRDAFRAVPHTSLSYPYRQARIPNWLAQLAGNRRVTAHHDVDRHSLPFLSVYLLGLSGGVCAPAKPF